MGKNQAKPTIITASADRGSLFVSEMDLSIDRAGADCHAFRDHFRPALEKDAGQASSSQAGGCRAVVGVRRAVLGGADMDSVFLDRGESSGLGEWSG